MEDLVELVNVLKSTLDFLGDELDLELPTIVVIGEASVGKSSVIDSLIGIDLLPKGPNITTKCPTVIELVQEDGPALTFRIVEIPGLIGAENSENLPRHLMIEELIKEHISQDNIIIFAVVDAKTDVKSSEIFKIIDKMGKMPDTVGIVSKIDLSESDDVKRIVENRLVVPGKGWILVKNRGDNEREVKSLETAQNDEMEYIKQYFQ
ncbi:Dynamin-1 [Thelohanellus kitauei]|uniref:Dynamin-1 n=1 Tax=Thelohanellus kitauei TaxID=669202 RepID=A0A0C2N0E3_THEKT|nr:Dynamin-1 [Thelohanellus kitauei]